MAATSSIQPPIVHALMQENALLRNSDSPAENRQDESTASEGLTLRSLHHLPPEEINRRLEKTHRELSNRRKILIKNLPQDTTSQEVHDVLRSYELKYCYVDKNKGTAFVTLLNGEQAQDAIRSFHQRSVRGRELTVQLQPTDALLCITNLPHAFSAAQFEELVRAHGNTERCFLVYSERTGYSKGYGFVEYMKKDSASRARSELLGRLLADRALMVQWADINQLTAAHLHSKCLCVDKLPPDFCNAEKLAQILGKRHSPVFCQLAQDEGSHVRGFAVVEYETAEQAEDVLMDMDRQLLGGHEIRVSFCAPGTSGRSTLAALIAAQGVMSNSRRGLLPEPSPAQLLGSMNNPAALQVLLRPYLTGVKHTGKFAQLQGLPFLRPPFTSALVQLGKVQQNALLGNSLMLQNLLQMQLAQQQLVPIKEKPVSSVVSQPSVPSLLGDPSRALLQKAMDLMSPGKGLLGDCPTDPSQDGAHAAAKSSSCGSGLVPYPPGRQILGLPAGGEPDGPLITDKPPSGPRATKPMASALQHARRNSTLAPKPASTNENSTTGTALAANHTSLLGEPPKELKIPTNPYLNLASVLPGIILQAPASGKTTSVALHGNAFAGGLALAPKLTPPLSTALYGTDTPMDYMSQYGPQYSQEAIQQWYQNYQAQAYSGAPQDSDYGKQQERDVGTTSYGDYGAYMQTINQCYSHTHMSVQDFPHRDTTKEADLSKTSMTNTLQSVGNGSAPYNAVPVMPTYGGIQHITPASVALSHSAQATADWSQYYYNQSQTRALKRDFPTLQEGPPDRPLVGQPSRGSGALYADQHKKKRI
ncbi:ribonucleoprotein PTB-binding 2-like isoform X2 [Brienomyrus brachyistius]|uniref:ribonucleoprotein PTB-binding 2-like isoform X2 n=1 Tax=Brienomyrus brachyistius TaxID=42636 RepID=UPI0020B3EFD1|nr:ribonucleoprotein PTB-binding 2-like isoform X2 [Brienomyrus brachyistius]